ncbi:MAG: glucosamine-6-phosphate deaminase [Verrucomicrobiota bacterium]|nr:glucosamine-6-phosphate deaminase [Verrucomicrobiota bacterium]
MNIVLHPNAEQANTAAARLLLDWLLPPSTRNVMVAAGNTPLELYRKVGEQQRQLSHLNIFALDEYVGVPLEEPRNCANLIRRSVIESWRIPPAQYHSVSSLEQDALQSVAQHERRIAAFGGLDVIILGLGQNGHLGFNEPGSASDSVGRLLDLQPISIEANRKWFGGDYAPSKGVTVGMKTILSARRVMILAYGPHKTAAVKAMVNGPVTAECPASFLQNHPHVRLFLDEAAAKDLAP